MSNLSIGKDLVNVASGHLLGVGEVINGGVPGTIGHAPGLGEIMDHAGLVSPMNDSQGGDTEAGKVGIGRAMEDRDSPIHHVGKEAEGLLAARRAALSVGASRMGGQIPCVTSSIRASTSFMPAKWRWTRAGSRGGQGICLAGPPPRPARNCQGPEAVACVC